MHYHQQLWYIAPQNVIFSILCFSSTCEGCCLSGKSALGVRLAPPRAPLPIRPGLNSIRAYIVSLAVTLHNVNVEISRLFKLHKRNPEHVSYFELINHTWRNTAGLGGGALALSHLHNKIASFAHCTATLLIHMHQVNTCIFSSVMMSPGAGAGEGPDLGM